MALRVDDVDLVRDRALVERFQLGDPAAFDTLYRRYFARLVRYCQKRVGDPLEAEEIAQEAFTRALRAMPTFEGERRFYPWMTVIAGRLCVDSHRRRSRSEPSSEVELGVIDGGQEKIVDAVDVEILVTALGRIAPRHREVLDLREQQGRSYQEIADHYEVTLGTVEALLFRARKALKREFMAVVGDDRNWAAVPVFGIVLRRVAAWRARFDAALPALPSLAGPVVAALLAVTAVTGAVGGAVLHHDRPGAAAASLQLQAMPSSTPTSMPELLAAVTDQALQSAAAPGSTASPDMATAAEPGRPPLAATPVADVKVGSGAADQGRGANEGAPVIVDTPEAQVGLDQERAGNQLTTAATNYVAQLLEGK